MITLIELLEDPKYREFFQTPPALPPIARDPRTGEPPWRVFVQLKSDRKWRKKDFWKYADAFKFLRRLLQQNKVMDGAIHCRKYTFSPPVRLVRIKGKYVIGTDGERRQQQKRVEWKPRLEGNDEDHLWCPYCRRPTVFKYYARHHALLSLGMGIDPSVRRCAICGSSTRITNYRSPV